MPSAPNTIVHPNWVDPLFWLWLKEEAVRRDEHTARVQERRRKRKAGELPPAIPRRRVDR